MVASSVAGLFQMLLKKHVEQEGIPRLDRVSSPRSPRAKQVSHYVVSSSSDLVQYGLTELMGTISIIKNSVPANLRQVTPAGVIKVSYRGLQIANIFDGSVGINIGTRSIATRGGIVIEFSDDYLDDAKSSGIYAQTVNTALGGLITIFIPEDIVLTADGARITIAGVRSDISCKAIGTEVLAAVESFPENSHVFINKVAASVGHVVPAIEVGATGFSQEGVSEAKGLPYK